jgi:hypothetical protein
MALHLACVALLLENTVDRELLNEAAVRQKNPMSVPEE